MKTLKYIPLLLIASLMFINMDCGRDDKCDHITQAPQEFLDYFFFPEGSWWVYEINDSNIDTVTIKTDSNISNAFGEIPCAIFYNAWFRHSNKLLYPEPNQFHFIQSHYLGNYTWILQSIYGYWSLGFYFIYPFQVNSTIDFKVVLGDTIRTYVMDTNSITINSKNYENVVRVHYLSQGLDTTLQIRKDIWIAKNVGIIKIDYYNGEHIDLIDHFINK